MLTITTHDVQNVIYVPISLSLGDRTMRETVAWTWHIATERVDVIRELPGLAVVGVANGTVQCAYTVEDIVHRSGNGYDFVLGAEIEIPGLPVGSPSPVRFYGHQVLVQDLDGRKVV